MIRRAVAVECLAVLAWSAPTQAAQPAKKYKNCTAMKVTYPRGVAKSVTAAGSTGAAVNAKVYNANKGLDRDKDGIACES